MYEVEKNSKYHMIIEGYDIDTHILVLDFVDYREYLDFIDNVLPDDVRKEYVGTYPYYRAFEAVLDSNIFREPLNQSFVKSHLAGLIQSELDRYIHDESYREYDINRIIAPSKIAVSCYHPIWIWLLKNMVIRVDGSFFSSGLSLFRGNDDATAFECLSSETSLDYIDSSRLESIAPCFEADDIAHIQESENDSVLLDLPDEIDMELVVKNVGQGNWNLLRDGYDMHKILYYDCGCSTRISKKDKQSILYTESADIDPDDYDKLTNGHRTAASQLIISHWHADHINLVSLMSDDDLEHINTVIVPDVNGTPTLIEYIRRRKYMNSKNKLISEISLTAQNVLMRLMVHSRNVYLVKPDTVVCGKNSKWVLTRGVVSRNKNYNGLILCLHNKQDSFILTGDNRWDNINSSYEIILKDNPSDNVYLVIPHHGGFVHGADTSIPLLKYMMNSGTNSRPVSAVVSVGAKGYGHPNKEAMDKVRDIGFRNIYSTLDNKRDIVVPEKRAYIPYV